MILKKLFSRTKKVSGKSFFDFTAKEKKKIIKQAVHDSSKLQLEMLKKFEKLHLNKAAI